MNWDPKTSVKELERVVDSFDHPAAEKLCESLIDSVRSAKTVLPDRDAHDVLDILRAKRYFDLLERVAEGRGRVGSHLARR